MILTFLSHIFWWLIRLVIPAPPSTPTPKSLSLLFPCPGCGHPRSFLTMIQTSDPYPRVQRTCLTCGSRVFHEPVYAGAQITDIHPATEAFAACQEARYYKLELETLTLSNGSGNGGSGKLRDGRVDSSAGDSKE